MADIRSILDDADLGTAFGKALPKKIKPPLQEHQISSSCLHRQDNIIVVNYDPRFVPFLVRDPVKNCGAFAATANVKIMLQMVEAHDKMYFVSELVYVWNGKYSEESMCNMCDFADMKFQIEDVPKHVGPNLVFGTSGCFCDRQTDRQTDGRTN